MNRREQVQNPELRALIDEAFAQMRQGKASDAVRTLVRCFDRMLEIEPAIQKRTVETPAGQRYPVLLGWPQLGTELSIESLRAGKPKIELKRDRFATSEAMTYFEFVLDLLIAAKL